MTRIRRTDEDVARAPVPWVAIVVLALLGTALGTGLALLDLARTRDVNGGLVHTGPDGPAAALLARELPDEPQFPLGQHDGPMFYAIARDPLRLSTVVKSLDRPRYRLQHPLLSWLAWAVHPNGGGPGLVWALFGVGVAGLFLGCLSMGALSTALRGPPYPALIFGILPGAMMSLRISVADTLAVALLVTAIFLSLRGHSVGAALVACAAVLAKEPMILGFLGVALWRRDRKGLSLFLAPLVVMGLWFLYLRSAVSAGGDQTMEFGVPFVGLGSAVSLWASGSDIFALVSVVPAVVISVMALIKRGFRHPLSIAVALQLGFLLLLTRDVIGLARNGSRMSLPVLALGIVLLVTPTPAAVTAIPPGISSGVGRPTDEGHLVGRAEVGRGEETS